MKAKKKKGLNFFPFNLLRRLYNWVLSWADSKYATWALAVNSFAESSFFPLAPDILQIALSVSKPKKSYWYALVSSIASVLGGLFGYLIGLLLFESVGKWIIGALGYWQYFVVGEVFAFWLYALARIHPLKMNIVWQV